MQVAICKQCNGSKPFCSRVCYYNSMRRGGTTYVKNVQNNVQKYGVTHSSKLEEVKQKVKNTNLERWDHECAIHSIDLAKKIQGSNLKKHGNIFPIASEHVRERIRESNKQKYGVDWFTQTKIPSLKANNERSKKKAHQTRKQNGSYLNSGIEEKFCQFLIEKFGANDVQRQIEIAGQSIDFYVKSRDLYVQFDGIYWHGLDRPIEEIRKFRNPRDVTIAGTYDRDQRQNQWFVDNGKKLVRITDKQFKNILKSPKMFDEVIA